MVTDSHERGKMLQRAFCGGWFIFFPFLYPQSMFLKRITQRPLVAGNFLSVIIDTYFDILWEFSLVTLPFAVLADQRILVIGLVLGGVTNGSQLVILASRSVLGHLRWLWCRMCRRYWWWWWGVENLSSGIHMKLWSLIPPVGSFTETLCWRCWWVHLG